MRLLPALLAITMLLGCSEQAPEPPKDTIDEKTGSRYR